MKLSALLAPLIAAKAPHDQIMAVVEAFEAQQADALERRRQADADRQARKRDRDKSRDVTLRHSDRSLTGAGDARVEVKTSNLDIEPKKEEQKESALSREFDQFWTAYPNKVGKPKAREALAKARKVASLEAILSGLSRYVASKPADRAWLNPATFLNQERWADQPANVVPMARGSPLSMVDFLGDVIETQEQRYAGPDPEIESPSQALRAIPGGRWTG